MVATQTIFAIDAADAIPQPQLHRGKTNQHTRLWYVYTTRENPAVKDFCSNFDTTPNSLVYFRSILQKYNLQHDNRN